MTTINDAKNLAKQLDIPPEAVDEIVLRIGRRGYSAAQAGRKLREVYLKLMKGKDDGE
jgi:hypothetical protein